MKKIVILASGTGTNFCALADAFQVTALICNRAGAPVLQEAEKRNVPAVLIDMNRFKLFGGKFKRNLFEAELLAELKRLQPDWICLAGYMLVLGKEIIEAYPNRILNIHPSLLPKFPGLHAIEQALEAGETETGCTVHYVTAGVDEGPIILQKRLSILPGDTPDTLHERLRPLEHQTYIEALRTVTG